VKATNVFLTIIFRVGLQPYLKLATTCMIKDTLIKHKETKVICEESGFIMANYIAFKIQPKSKLVA
jgi:predicted nuclease of restriction endonuclease-like RecB superfamily